MSATTNRDPATVPTVPADLSWHVVQRWQEYLGESRANVLRIVAVGVFYLVELASRSGILHAELSLTAHRTITLICSVWIAVGLGVLLALRNQIFPRWLKFATTGFDLFLITLVLMVGTGPSSPMVAGYFVILAMSGLRLSLPLVRCATVGAAISYLAVNAHVKWVTQAHGVPRYHQVQTVLALLIVGIVVGQIVRQVKRVAAEYHERRSAA